MRMNLRRLTVLLVAVGTLWFLVSHSSLLELPSTVSPRHSIVDIENRISKLQLQMKQQLTDSNSLLDQVKQHLKKNRNNFDKEEPKDPFQNEIDEESKYFLIHILQK